MVHVRRAVSFDPVWDDTLTWYERAVRVMLDRPATQVTSWAYQAAIHGTFDRARKQSWNTCEHGGWYFFPWHRCYLAAFEQIVRAEVVALGGPEAWALPYWNYERRGMGSLPPAFRAPQRPDGANNALFTTGRLPQVNAGAPLASLLRALGPGAMLSSAAGLAATSFSSGVANGFGGGPTPSSFQADRPSDIESFLHGNVHVLVGLGGGLMSRFQTAAQDPVFWLHHANIDRLWAQWASTPGHSNPTGQWLTQKWTFFNPDRSKLVRHPADVVDTVAQLDYRYDTVPARRRARGPVGAAGEEPSVVGVGAPGDDEEAAERELEPVGWSDAVTLDGHRASASVVVDQQTVEGIAGRRGIAAGPPPRAFLELSDIEARESPGIVYGVYVHPTDVEREPDDALVGVVSFFGMENMPRRRDRHDHRMRYVFDVTDLLERLGVEATIGAGGITVSFRPLGPGHLADGDGDEPDVPPVSIGRVALLMG